MPSGRAGTGAGRRCCTRADLLTVALAAMLCSATYFFSVWHNGRGAADKIVLGPAPFVGGATLCGRDDASADAAELDFEAHHDAEKAGLSVSSTTAAVSGRRALRAAAPVDTGRRGRSPWPASRGVVWAGSSARGAETGGDKGWPRIEDGEIRFTNPGAAHA